MSEQRERIGDRVLPPRVRSGLVARLCPKCGQWCVGAYAGGTAYCSDRCRNTDFRRKARAARLVPLMLRGQP